MLPSNSNWSNAVATMRRRLLEKQLQCPNCLAKNAPGKTVIEIEEDGYAVCAVCRHEHLPEGVR